MKLKNMISILVFNYFLQFLVIFLLLYSFSLRAENNQPISAPWVGRTLSGTNCTGGVQNSGPYDFTNLTHKKNFLPVVEKHHFNKNVEYHMKGITTHVTGDLDFVLRAFPNHHKALLSTIRYQIKANNKLVNRQLLVPAECYLQRAINFRPKDAASIALYAYYLRKIGRHTQAEKKFRQALIVSPDNSKIEYSYSLLLIDLKKYDQALIYAKKAYEHGHPPKKLKHKLVKLGVWK